MHRCSWVNDDPLYIDYHKYYLVLIFELTEEKKI